MKQFTGRSRGYSVVPRLLTFVFLAIVHCQDLQGQENDDALKQRFLQEAPLQWERYVQEVEMVQGNYVVHTTFGFNNATVQNQDEYRRNQTGKIVQTIYQRHAGGKKEYAEQCFGMNARYAFELRRNRPGSDWVFVGYSDLRKESIPEQLNFHMQGLSKLNTLLVRLDWELLSEAVRQPSFRVERCKAIQRDGEELVEVVFAYPHAESKTPPWNRAQGGTLLLDPKRFWVVRHSELKTNGGTIKKHLSEMAETSDSVPIPKLFEEESRHTFTAEQVTKGFPPKTTNKTRYEFDLHKPNPLPDDEEFTLRAFGLPEPKGLETPRKPSRWWLWFILMALASLALGVYARHRLGRRKMREAQAAASVKVS
jgi:hypothetical protein